MAQRKVYTEEFKRDAVRELPRYRLLHRGDVLTSSRAHT